MEIKKYKRLPYGISNFETIMTENYVYVDKTRYIEQLKNASSHYQFLIRPRKFGKSQFFSILSHYYDLNRANRFDQLFGELYIGKNPTLKRNCYLILQFIISLNRNQNEENRFYFPAVPLEHGSECTKEV
ncbi:MAG: AAA family ATPase [Tannerella sp.]|jgi:uncharacterized membrane protein|nr:AAA family ATPase [Tannerella sp.]